MRYQLQPEERAFCERVICAGDHAVKYHTFALVEECLAEGVPGDFVECGVMAGAHPAIMLYVLRKHGVRDRKVHLFDSFEGIPRATENDPPEAWGTYGRLAPGGPMESSGISVSSVENTLFYLKTWGVYDPEIVVIHKGWFEETMSSTANSVGAIAILRVDVDLYSSTRTVYSHMYDKVVPGGFVIDDDYGSHDAMSACRRAMEEVIGPQRAIAVEGQPSTSWWRKT